MHNPTVILYLNLKPRSLEMHRKIIERLFVKQLSYSYISDYVSVRNVTCNRIFLFRRISGLSIIKYTWLSHDVLSLQLSHYWEVALKVNCFLGFGQSD